MALSNKASETVRSLTMMALTDPMYPKGVLEMRMQVQKWEITKPVDVEEKSLVLGLLNDVLNRHGVK